MLRCLSMSGAVWIWIASGVCCGTANESVANSKRLSLALVGTHAEDYLDVALRLVNADGYIARLSSEPDLMLLFASTRTSTGDIRDKISSAHVAWPARLSTNPFPPDNRSCLTTSTKVDGQVVKIAAYLDVDLFNQCQINRCIWSAITALVNRELKSTVEVDKLICPQRQTIHGSFPSDTH